MGGGISSSLEPPPVFTKCATHLPISQNAQICANFEFYSFFCDTQIAHGKSCDHILACGGLIRSLHGLTWVHMDVARLDSSIGVFLVRFRALRGV